MHVQCPRCGESFASDPSTAGRRISCPHCDQNVRVPGLSQPAAQTKTEVGTTRRDRVRVDCPVCQLTLFAKESEIGTEITCPDCLESIMVTRPSAPPTTPDPTPSVASDRVATSATTPPLDRSEKSARPQRDDQPAQPSKAAKAHEAAPKEAAPQSKAAPQSTEPAIPDVFGLTCPVCDSRLHAKREQIGRSINCPDCFSQVEVTRPRPSRAAQSPTREPPQTGRRRAGAKQTGESFGISCSLCGTRLHVRESMIGTEVKCPDCYSIVTVRAPTKPTQAPTQEARMEVADEEADLKLSAPALISTAVREKQMAVAPPPDSRTATTQVDPAPPATAEAKPPAQTPPTRSPGPAPEAPPLPSPAAEAPSETETSPDDDPDTTPRWNKKQRLGDDSLGPFMGRVFRGWLDWGFLVRAILASGSFIVPAVVWVASQQLAWVFFFALLIPLVMTLMLAVVLVCAVGITVIQNASAGLNHARPTETETLELAVNGLTIISAGFCSMMIGMVAMIFFAGVPGYVMGLSMGLAVFPVCLLSMLDDGSVFTPLSPVVMRSLPQLPRTWGLVTLAGFAMMAATVGIGYWINYLGGAAIIYMAPILPMLFLIVYARAIGVLGARIDALPESVLGDG